MDETKRAWDEVGDGFVRFGRMISARYRERGEGRSAPPGGAEQGTVADAIRRATDELDRAFTSIGDTLRDEEAREHLRVTGQKLNDALDVTFRRVGEEVRRAVGGRRPTDPSERPSPPPPPETG